MNNDAKKAGAGCGEVGGRIRPSSSRLVAPPGHPPPSTFHLPPSTLHPPPSTCALGRRLAVTLTVLSATLWALVAPAAAPQPAWSEPDAPLRVVFAWKESDPFALVRLPARVGAAYVADVRVWLLDARRPARVVWADDDDVYVLIDCRGGHAGAEFIAYALAGPQRVVASADGPVDPTPVRVMARRAYGQDPPTSADQLRMLEARADARTVVFAVEDFDRVRDHSERWRGGNNWEKNAQLIRLTTWLLAPADGRWVFTLKGDNAAWLKVDDVLVSEQTYSRGREQWLGGKPVALTPGVHRVTIDTVSMARRSGYSLSVAWKRTDAAQGAAPDLAWVTGGALTQGRVERRDGDLHAFARSVRDDSYRFVGCPTIFVPVKLRSASVSWSGATLSCIWQDAAGRRLGTGAECDTVVAGGGQRVPVNLIVHDAAGHSATDTTDVATDRIPSVEYGVSSRLQGAPAFCYGDDPVLPELHLRATSPDSIAFDVTAAITYASGRQTNVSERVRLMRSWGRMKLPVGRAEEFGAIRWNVLHGRETIQSGAWVFDAAPFDAMPETVDGDALRRAGEGVTFIARRASAGDLRRVSGLHAPEQRLLLLDGFLVPPGAAALDADDAGLDYALAHGLPGGRGVHYQRVSLKALEADDDATGIVRLMPFTQLEPLLPADLVVLAPSLNDIHEGEKMDVFERRLAALVGLICGPGKASLVLVAPPACDVLPGCGCVPDPSARPCVHAREGRAFAEVVVRVADAYGLPVVDLYTPFITAVSVDPLVRNGVLTPSGVAQATRVLLRTVYGRGGE
jgi:hypothetical protein